MSVAPFRLDPSPDGNPQDAKPSDSTPHQAMVTVPLDLALRLLSGAFQDQQSWLHDFGDEHVTISVDLYEVLETYRQYQVEFSQ